jgi:ABC-type sugar transport system substrate-binding protein
MATQGKVIVSLLSEKQEFQRLQAEDARAAGVRTGLEVEIVYADNDPAVQLHQVFQAVSAPAGKRPAAIVLEPAAAAGLDGAARASVEAGIGWVLLGDRPQLLEPLQKEFPGKLILAVSTDNAEVGRIQARIFRALLPRGGNIVYVEGPSFQAAAIHRRNHVQSGLPGSSIEIVKLLSGDWTADSAERAASIWLKLAGKSARPALIGSQNDEMGLGVRKAIAALRPEWSSIPVTGVDGLPEGGQRLVREKVLAATIITPSPAGPAVELVARSLRGERIPPLTLMPPRAYPPVEDLRPAH